MGIVIRTLIFVGISCRERIMARVTTDEFRSSHDCVLLRRVFGIWWSVSEGHLGIGLLEIGIVDSFINIIGMYCVQGFIMGMICIGDGWFVVVLKRRRGRETR